MNERRWCIGDLLIVTGDTQAMGHRYEAGTKVVVRELSERNPDWYRCNIRNDVSARNKWWVHGKDLESEDVGPTDEEVLEVFGLARPTPCTTCGCTCGGAS